jgi:hypothetical protein
MMERVAMTIDSSWAMSYGPGASKLLAKRNITLAATNSDNYAFYAASKFMEKRWKQYPKYPSAWDPDKTQDENREAQENELGFPANYQYRSYDIAQALLPSNLPNDPVYPVDDYPDWYQPIVKAAPNSPLPDVSEPTDNLLTYNGPTDDDIVYETSNGSPEINDCFRAFGSMRMAPTFEAIQGKKGGTWWAGVSVTFLLRTVNPQELMPPGSTYSLARWQSTTKTTGEMIAPLHLRMSMTIRPLSLRNALWVTLIRSVGVL